MKKLLTISIVLIFITLSISAQKTKDVLYLKNGSIIYGKLLEVANNQIKLQSTDGSLFIYPMDEVEKLERETPYFVGRKVTGLGVTTEGGFLIGAPENSDYVAPFSFNLLGNYTLATRHIVSIGSGVEFIGTAYIPLFAEYKYLLKDKRVTPFFFTRAGKLFHVSENDAGDYTYSNYDKYDFKGGFSFAAGIGISWAKDELESNLTFAYRYLRTSYRQGYYYNGTYDNDYKYVNNFNRLEIKFGFRF